MDVIQERIADPNSGQHFRESNLGRAKADPDEQRLRDDPGVRELLEKFQGVSDQVERAIKILAKEKDGLEAMRRIVPVYRDGKINVFFSYKKKDEATAQAIVKILRKHSVQTLNISYMAEFPEKFAGKKWREKIRKEVKRANWFILLLPDSSEDWDWCLYETGMFDREPTSADRLICIHHPEIEIPSAIREYHAVPANASNMNDFLHMVFVNQDSVPGKDPINPGIKEDIPKIAKQIVNVIRPPRQDFVHVIYEPHLKLRVENPQELAGKEDLDNAIIEDINAAALKIFGRELKPATLGELRDHIEEPIDNGRWRDELCQVIRNIAQGRLFKQVQAVFHTPDEKVYRPVAHAVDRSRANADIESFHITFAEEVGALDTSDMPKGFANLATMLRLAFRFRWEVLEKFGKGHLGEKDVERLENVLQRLEQDAESRGLADRDRADLSAFSPDELQRVKEMYDYWHTLRDQNSGDGALDIALREKDTSKISKILEEMVPLNQDFLEMASNRFSELVVASTCAEAGSSRLD